MSMSELKTAFASKAESFYQFSKHNYELILRKVFSK